MLAFLGSSLLGAALFGSAALAWSSPTSWKEPLPEPVKKALKTISHKDVERHQEFLTSDACAGRGTPQPGLFRAAEYIAEHYRKCGLEPVGTDGTFMQPFDASIATFAEDDFLEVEAGDQRKRFAPGVDFVPVRGSGSGEVSGEIVFAGYGITAKSERYDDFKKESVRGKIVLVMTHEPRENKKGRAFKGRDWTDHGRIDHKAVEAAKRGAKAVLVVTDPRNHEDLSVLKTEYPRWPARGQRGPKKAEIPVVHISSEVADLLVGKGKISTWQQGIDSKVKGSPRAIEGTRVSLKVAIDNRNFKVPNVVALRRGSDPRLSDEVIVIGGHYDHLGADAWGRIYRGADDNGSGTACLLEIAEALSSPDIEMKRSILFINFAAEEVGLVGAKEYCKRPLISLRDTIAMLNMDMVGRGRPNDISAVGLSYSKDLEAATRRALKATRVKLRVDGKGDRYFKRSDQYAFWEKGVPVLFFMEPEEHEDYHRVTDTSEKIDNKKVAKVATLVSGLAYLLSENKKRPTGKTGKR